MKRAFVLGLVLAACASERAPDRAGERAPDRGDAVRAELDALRAKFPSAPLVAAPDRATRSAHVTLPARADGDVVVEGASGVALRFRIVDAPPAVRSDVDGVAVYAGAGIVHRVHDAGVEDYVAFEARPAREEVRYSVDVSRAAGLRLVGDVLELLDASGAPRLRVATPFVIDAGGARVPATLAVERCAFDASPAPPWGRAVTPPGAERCDVRVAWSGVRYPALLDPGWTTANAGGTRDAHTAVKLASGRVLVLYGNTCGGGCFLAGGTELYDPVTNTFATVGGTGDKGVGVSGVALANGKALIAGPSTYLFDSGTGMFATTGACNGCTLTLLPSGKVLGTSGAAASVYDPATGVFTPTGSMNASRSGYASAILPSGKVLVAGGSALASAEIYDPTTGAFTPTGSMGAARTNHGAFTLASGKVLVVGGAGATAELYDPVAATFTPTGALLQARTDFSAALLASGKVMVTGGFIGTNATTSTERYEPVSGTFVTAPSMQVARGFHRTTLLASGALLATGGRSLNTNFGVSTGAYEVLSVVAAGGTCATNDDCASGVCDQGVCCSAACGAACHACTAGTGACDVVTGRDDPDTCTGATTCDAAGACKKKIAEACGAATECASGFCADGACCDRACNGTCEACDGLARGACGPIAGPPHGARSCGGGGSVCAGACDGVNAMACAYPSATTGCGTSCTDGTRTARACDGKGGCVDLPARTCPGNFTCADATSCKTSCAADADCLAGYACASGKCAPTAKCDGDHTVTSADGKSTTDCTPFKCNTTTRLCKTGCTTSDDCASPFVCDRTFHCGAAPAAVADNGGGCAMGGRSGGDALVVVLAALLGARRRRSRH